MANAVPTGISLINILHTSQDQEPATVAGVTSPSITVKYSSLLGLPVEIQIEIIKLLRDDFLHRRQQTHPLMSLRLTCKQLEALCNPVFSQRLYINRRWERPALERRKELAPKFAKYLKAVDLPIWGGIGGDNLFFQSVCTTILEQAVSLRRMALFHLSSDTTADNQLLSAISKLSTLEDVSIVGLGSTKHVPKYDTVHTTLHYCLLNRMLDYHHQQLRAFVIWGMTPIHESTFLKLRDTASQLRKLSISGGLTIETRNVFTDPCTWACAGRLEALYFHRCAINPAIIARHLGAGVFGPLHTLSIVMCGDVSDDPTEPAATIWTIPPLKSVAVERFNDWRMDKLRSIHAREVYITRTWGGPGPCIRAFRQSTTFPEAVELHVEETWDDTYLEDLRRGCAMRGLTKVERRRRPES